MSLLSIVRNAHQELALTAPVSVQGSQDLQVQQMQALLNREAKALSQRTDWTALTFETNFTTVATENQGVLATIAPNIKFVVNDTIYNRTLRRPVFGPLSPQVWQQREAMFIAGPWNQFRIQNGFIKFIPIPVAGQQCFFEYVSKAVAVTADGLTTKTDFTLDTDVGLLDEELLTLGLIWRFKKAKGLDYEADIKEYEVQVLNAIGRDGSKPTLSANGGYDDVPVGVFVPAGSWNV
jgi:hypothetical protein